MNMRRTAESRPTPFIDEKNAEDKYPAAAYLHPPEVSESTKSAPRHPSWLAVTSQMHYASSISQSRDDSSEERICQRQNSDLTHRSRYFLEQRVKLCPSEDKLLQLHMAKD
jgi:hypothetical protein